MDVICETDMFGSMGAVAWMVTVPTKPLHCAIPLALMVTPDAMGLIMEDDLEDIGIIGKGLPTVQSTCGVAVIGSMLKWAVAVNCTALPGKFCAFAEAGVTVMLCICRVFIMVIIPLLQATTVRDSRPARESKTRETGNEQFCRRCIAPPFGRQQLNTAANAVRKILVLRH